jgi:hypothetical protein
MIIRRLASSLQLITQPDHAALAERIVRQWQADGFPESPRQASILRANAQHDNGWDEFDQTLVVDEKTGQLLDFVDVPDSVKRETSSRGIDQLSGDPYAAALVAQHRLHVYRRYADRPDWKPFFDGVAAARDAYLLDSGAVSLEQLLRDYRFVRAGDLASLAFCNNWGDVEPTECGYAMRLEGASLTLSPDPFAGQTIEIAIAAREIPLQRFESAQEARLVLASAPVVTLTGSVRGAASGYMPLNVT